MPNLRTKFLTVPPLDEVLGGAVGRVRRQPLRPQAKALLRPLDHPLLRRHLGLADRGGRFHIDDDGVLQVDQVVGAIGEEGEPAVCSRPTRGRVGMRDKLWHNRRRRAEGGIIEHRQILSHGMVRRLGGLPLATRHAALPVSIGLDHAGVDREAFAANQSLGHAALHGRLEHLAQQIALAEATVPVLREGRVVGHRAIEPEPAEPTVGEVQVNLFAQPPLRANAEAIADSSAPGRSRADPTRCKTAPACSAPRRGRQTDLSTATDAPPAHDVRAKTRRTELPARSDVPPSSACTPQSPALD